MENKDTKNEKNSKQKSGSGLSIGMIIAAVVLVAAIIVVILVIINKNKKGDDSAESHKLIHIEARDATIYEKGSISCYFCTDCGKYYADEDAKKELSADEVESYVFDKDANGLYEYGDDKKLYYVKNGVCDPSYSGFAKLISDWYYVSEGKVDTSITSVIRGEVYGEDAWWNVVNGKVEFVDTVARNENGWWYIKNGKVEFTNTIGENEEGKWYIVDGKVDYSFSGKYEKEGIVYTVKEGRVTHSKKKQNYDSGLSDYYLDKGNSSEFFINSTNEKDIIDGFSYYYKKTGIRPYLMILEVLPSESIDDYLEKLHKETFGDEKGVLMVYVVFEHYTWVYGGEDGTNPIDEDAYDFVYNAIKKSGDETDLSKMFGNALRTAAINMVGEDDTTSESSESSEAVSE
ncbi:hypothetical protein SAMN04487934_101577 [Eubacterium ruminantium]|nr:hypothetical protein SAMN04487934_101577 [Eubacterium ruminantium]